MLRFQNIEAFWLLLIIPIVIFITVWHYFNRKRNLEKYADAHLIKSLIPNYSNMKIGVKYFFVLLAFIFGIIALANPQYGFKKEKIQVEG